uniref:Calmodulin-binding domain-containing protein n=1 Tax=Cajanus cajan TaxID=3821 RepID=A0A151TMG7_CAJCA|nr:hypothetical protein KK1_021884 [Cajanus cajan]
MVQRKVLSKLDIQADRVKSDKSLANLKPSSHHQDGTARGTNKMKKMMKPRSIQLSYLEPPQSRKPPPLHVSTIAASPQQHKHLMRRSPNYMKPTSSSDAKKELLPVSHRNTRSSSDGKNLTRKSLSNSKASFVSCKELAKTLSRSSSLNSTRTSKTPSFKPCKACSRKFTSAVLFEDVNAPERATCSSTLKDYKFPEYLMLHPGATESEGASVMKVCPYSYCSLNDHGHAPLPPLKSFMSARRHLLETQRWKMLPSDTQKDSDIHGKPACDETDTVEADSKGSFQNAEDANENHPHSWFHEETCTGSYSNDASYDEEHHENIELVESKSQYSDMDWEEEYFCEFNYEDGTDSSICSMEETDPKLESLSEGSHDISEMLLVDIFSNHYSDILVEEVSLQEAEEEKSTSFEAQPHCTNSVMVGTGESIDFVTQEIDYPSNGISFEYEQSTLTKEVFQYLTNAEDSNNRENEKQVNYEVGYVSMVLDEETVENSEGHKTSESCEIDKSCEDKSASVENNDDGIIHSSDVPEESTIIVQKQKLWEKNHVRGSSKLQSTGGEEQHMSKNWQWGTKRKRLVEEDEEMGKINPRKPNFLTSVAEPEPEKVELKHQMIDERKNAEEWMLDFALRQTVTRLAPAGKRKVSLLVEAFETVTSMPKCETRMRNDSAFARARPIQACS